MPIKPMPNVLNAEKAMKDNPDFGKDAFRTIVAETPELRDALENKGLIKVEEK